MTDAYPCSQVHQRRRRGYYYQQQTKGLAYVCVRRVEAFDQQVGNGLIRHGQEEPT